MTVRWTQEVRIANHTRYCKCKGIVYYYLIMNPESGDGERCKRQTKNYLFKLDGLQGSTNQIQSSMELRRRAIIYRKQSILSEYSPRYAFLFNIGCRIFYPFVLIPLPLLLYGMAYSHISPMFFNSIAYSTNCLPTQQLPITVYPIPARTMHCIF